MITIDKNSRIPVYEQIKNQIISLIRVGVYPPNSKVPSIRTISSENSININTVKKAFAELELSGVIYTVPGTGSFVSENALQNSNLSAKVMREISDSIKVAKTIGVSREDIFELINSVYKEED